MIREALITGMRLSLSFATDLVSLDDQRDGVSAVRHRAQKETLERFAKRSLGFQPPGSLAEPSPAKRLHRRASKPRAAAPAAINRSRYRSINSAGCACPLRLRSSRNAADWRTAASCSKENPE